MNLGGWLVPEPFIVPALFEPYVNSTPMARDEYTLSQAMALDTANGGLDQLERHYDTFIVSSLMEFFVHFGSHPTLTDRRRFRSNRWCRSQLDSSPYPLLGYREVPRRAVLGKGRLEVHLEGVQVGQEVRFTYQLGLAHHSRISKQL